MVVPARLPGEELPEMNVFEEVDEMLAERVKTWPKKWMAEGFEKGKQEGRQEGEQKGRLDGLRDWACCSSVSSAGFHRLTEARQDQLTRWMERLLDASSPGEVFQS